MSKFCVKVTVVNDLGLHARPAAIIAKIARQAKGSVNFTVNEKIINAASMIDILTLSCSKNTEIKVSITQEIDIKILKNIVAKIKSGLGE